MATRSEINADKAIRWFVARYMLGDNLEEYFTAEQRVAAEQIVRRIAGEESYNAMSLMEQRGHIAHKLIPMNKDDPVYVQRIVHAYTQARTRKAQGRLSNEHPYAKALYVAEEVTRMAMEDGGDSL